MDAKSCPVLFTDYIYIAMDFLRIRKTERMTKPDNPRVIANRIMEPRVTYLLYTSIFQINI
jgi:hypothetical protein